VLRVGMLGVGERGVACCVLVWNGFFGGGSSGWVGLMGVRGEETGGRFDGDGGGGSGL